ncbi:Cullin [Melampsora americana]|nr:Cullin [Melampsora americana]
MSSNNKRFHQPAHSIPRSSKVKPTKRHGEPATDTWSRLAKAITEILNHNASKLSFEEHYRYAYNMVLYKQGTKLFNGVRDLVAHHLDDQANQKIKPNFPSQERFLKSVREVWDDHVTCMKKLRDVLKYMDKVYTAAPGNNFDWMPPVWDLGLYIFLTHVIRSPHHPISSHLINAIITLITSERLGDTINSSVIRSATEMLTDLTNHSIEIIKRVDDKTGGNGGGPVGESIYSTDFEPLFLAESREFYKNEGNQLLSSCNASEYLKKIEKRLAEEEIRSQAYLHLPTEHALALILDEELIQKHISGILHHSSGGINLMIEHDAKDDLKRLYILFLRIPEQGLNSLKEAVKDWIKERGNRINEGFHGDANRDEPQVGNNSNALQWVSDVIALRDKFLLILSESFSANKLLQSCIDEAFSSFINAHKRSAEFISLFIDDKLKKGLKGKTDEEIESELDKTIAIYRHLHEKDLFEKYYKAHLAKRLLFGKSVSEDTERNMLSKLKVESGSAFTRDSEGMLKDLKMSNEMGKSFKDWCSKKHPAVPLDLVVTVGSSSMWPMSQGTNQTKSPCILPKLLDDSIKLYERFYSTRHSGRRLTWHTELGSLEIKIKFNKSTHELNLSTLAGVVVLLFDGLDESRKFTYPEIREATGMSDGDLKRTLQSLACAKYKILLKEPRSREINETSDQFKFNYNFTNPMTRIKIQTITNKVETKVEQKETNDRVEEDRRLHTEACIVRVMKTRQRLGYTELNHEVINQLAKRFKPTPTVIKTSIEKLIEKEYLARDNNDRKILIYLVCDLFTSSWVYFLRRNRNVYVFFVCLFYF